MGKKVSVFVYGTLKRGYCNNMLLRTSTFVGEAITCKPLYMYSYGIPMVAVPSSKKTVMQALPIIGEVYRVSKTILQILDTLEGHPDLYIRTLEKVQIENKNIKAYIYVKSDRRWYMSKEDMCYNKEGSLEGVRIIDNKYEWVGTWMD